MGKVPVDVQVNHGIGRAFCAELGRYGCGLGAGWLWAGR